MEPAELSGIFADMIRIVTSKLVDAEVIEHVSQSGIVFYDHKHQRNQYVCLFPDAYKDVYCYSGIYRIRQEITEVLEELKRHNPLAWKHIATTFPEVLEITPTTPKGEILNHACELLKRINFEYPVTEELYISLFGGTNSSYRLLSASYRYRAKAFLQSRKDPIEWILGCELEALVFPMASYYYNRFFRIEDKIYALVVFCDRAAKVKQVDNVVEPLLKDLKDKHPAVQYDHNAICNDLLREQIELSDVRALINSIQTENAKQGELKQTFLKAIDGLLASPEDKPEEAMYDAIRAIQKISKSTPLAMEVLRKVKKKHNL
jgi:hypothetical protein